MDDAIYLMVSETRKLVSLMSFDSNPFCSDALSLHKTPPHWHTNEVYQQDIIHFFIRNSELVHASLARDFDFNYNSMVMIRE